MSCRRIFGLVSLLLMLLALGCGGRRVLEVQVVQDGNLVLRTVYDVSDRLTTPALWESLEGRPFEGKLQTSDPQQVVLRGNIRLVVRHVNNQELASATIEELCFVRAPGSGARWQLAPKEVQRTAQAAGL